MVVIMRSLVGGKKFVGMREAILLTSPSKSVTFLSSIVITLFITFYNAF